MNLKKLGDIYSFSTQEVQQLTTELYESLHDDDGNPVLSRDKVSELVKDFRMKVNIEIATVKDACLEYNHQ